MEVCTVARFYSVDPEAVDDWIAPKFLDRQEYMFYQMHLDNLEIQKAKREADRHGR